MEVTAESIKTAYPDVYKAIADEAYQAGLAEGQKAGIDSGIAQGKLEGATAERERIAGIKAVAGKSIVNPNIAAMVDTLIADGKTTPDQAAASILGAINKDLGDHYEAFTKDNAVVTGSGIIPGGGGSGDGKEPGFEALVTQYMDTNKVSKGAAIKAVAGENPAAHDAWLATLKKKEGSDV